MLHAAVRSHVELEMATRDRIHRNGFIGRLDRDRRQVRQSLLLGFLDIAEQGTGGCDGQGKLLKAKAAEVMQVEKFQQLASAAVAIEIPGRAPAQAGERKHDRRPAVLVGNQYFSGRQARQFCVEQIFIRDFGDQKPATRQIGPGQAEGLPGVGSFTACDRQQ